MIKKIAIIVDDYYVSKHVYDFVKRSTFSKKFDISCIINKKNSTKKKNVFEKIYFFYKKKGIINLANFIFFKLIITAEIFILQKIKNYNIYLSKDYNLKDLNIKAINLKPETSNNGQIIHYTEKDLKKIKNEDFSILIRACSGIIKGDILNVCKNGIISFHHGDNNVYRGGPPAFWEILDKKAKTGFIIQKLNNMLDGGDVLFKGFIPTSWIYSLNLFRIYSASFPYLDKIIENLLFNGDDIKIYEKQPYYNSIYKLPNLNHQFQYIFFLIKKLTINIVNKIINKKDIWKVAYQFSNSWRDINLSKSKIIHNPKNRFLADPFIIYKNKLHFCFVEDYDLKKKRGSISVYQINKDRYSHLGYCLQENFHLSYPFIFEYKNELYMCPETHEISEIRLYKCTNFPLKWKLEKILFKDVDAVDTNIFFKNDKWWLISNMSFKNFKDFGSQLYIFYSDNPISGKWISNKNNPVIFDSEKSRNGGLIIHKDEVYRVAQKYGFTNYGESLSISKILEINDQKYTEDFQFDIKPHFFKNINGIHTYNYSNGLVMFDFKKKI